MIYWVEMWSYTNGEHKCVANQRCYSLKHAQQVEKEWAELCMGTSLFPTIDSAMEAQWI